jgi:GDP-4-dehydro-6-deoxy-D-mannose reductase
MRVGNIDVVRDFSDVRDIVRAYRMVLESEDCDTIYNIGSGRGIALKEILETLQDISAETITVETDPDLFRPVDNPVIVCDHTLITKKLGWKPEHDLLDTVREMFCHYVSLSKSHSLEDDAI